MRITCKWIMTYCSGTKCKKKLRTDDSVKRHIQEDIKTVSVVLLGVMVMRPNCHTELIQSGQQYYLCFY